MVAMAGRTLGGLTARDKDRRMATRIITLALTYMAAATKYRHLLARCYFIRRRAAGG